MLRRLAREVGQIKMLFITHANSIERIVLGPSFSYNISSKNKNRSTRRAQTSAKTAFKSFTLKSASLHTYTVR